MFDDPKRDLKRIEKELLAQKDEDWLERELADIRDILDIDYTKMNNAGNPKKKASGMPAAPRQPKGPSVGNTDRVDVDLSSYSDELMEEPVEKKEKSLRGLVILVLLELLGIAAIGVYWLIQIL